MTSLNGFRVRNSYEGSEFQTLYENLIISKSPELTDEKKIKLLKWALFFVNETDDGIRRLGYRIIVRYSNAFKDYIPLYDIALNKGFIPVSKFIENYYLTKEQKEQIGQSFFKSFLSSYTDIFKDGDKYLSEGQKALIDFSRQNVDSLIVAPTSYGKSEMMISKVVENLGKRVCIIVPSKALLSQTKRRLLDNHQIASEAKRVITHPEMYRPEDKTFIAVFTQERLLRLMQKDSGFFLDVLLIDEAHNLLEKGERGDLLLQALLISKHRNSNIELKFYTPFIATAESLETPYASYSLTSQHVREYIKMERYFIYDARDTKRFTFYDQFIDKHIDIDSQATDEFDFIQKHKAVKNIVYLNKPRDVEDVAVKLSERFTTISFSDGAEADFKQAYQAIADFLHPDYKLLSCLKRGVIYHHGKIPEIIRLYIEDVYSKHPAVSCIVTSSTLLEGVNIPAEKMFLLSTKRGRSLLTRSAFKNLTGRICRFREIFSETAGHLRMLEPEIYVVNGNHASKGSNPYKFLNTRAKIQPVEKDVDLVENILLKSNPSIEDRPKVQTALEYIENIEKGVIEDERYDIRYVNTDIAKSCFKNNIHEFDIHRHEKILNKNLQAVSRHGKLSEPKALLDTVAKIFINNIEHFKQEDEFTRLKHEPTRNFYSLILSWKMKGAPYKEMISSFLRYWEEKQEKARSPDDHHIFVGHSWGEEKRSEEDHVPQYMDLRKKKSSQRINIAIIRIKEEQDFLEYKLMKFIEVLNDLELLDSSFYDHIRYGSSDRKVICLLKNGISMELAKCLLSGKYNQYFSIDLATDTVRIQRSAIEAMELENENKILVFELGFHAT